MKIVLDKIVTSGDMSAATINSNGVLVDQLFCGSIQAVWTGAPQGTLKLQVSNDNVPVKPGSPIANAGQSQFVGSDPAGNVVNWSDYTGSDAAVLGAGNTLWNLTTIGYKWIRVVYTKTSGTGSLNVIFFGKG